ncbi:MAG: zinc ribbon domain-containing protein [Bdellovibrionota bacterium]
MTQPRPLREQLKALEHLQELDLKIDSVRKNRDSIPGALKALEDNLAKAKSMVLSKQTVITEAEKVQRQTQAAMDLNRDRQARSNTKMDNVHNSNEFNAANKEIEQLKKVSATLEEQNKKSTVEIEAHTKELGNLSEQVTKAEQERNAKAEQLSSQTSKLEKEIQSLMSERGQYTTMVERGILSVYDRVRGARGGLGIVPAVGGRCKGCNMVVPPQLYILVQRAIEMQACPSCHRILFVPAPSGESTTEAQK